MTILDPMEDANVISTYLTWNTLKDRRAVVTTAIAEHISLAETLGITSIEDWPDWREGTPKIDPDWDAIDENDWELRGYQRELELLDRDIPPAWEEVKAAWKIAAGEAKQAATADLEARVADIESAFEEARVLAVAFRTAKGEAARLLKRQGPEEFRRAHDVFLPIVPYPYGYHAHLK